MSKDYVFDNNRKLVTFNKLDERNVINGYTLKPFDFRRNYVTDEVIEENIYKLEDIFDYKFAIRMQPEQTHTNKVDIVTIDNLNTTFPETDGLVTNLKGILLTTISADCQCMLLYDPVKKVIGNVHSGWKGTLGRIVVNAINIMINNYGCNVSDIEVYQAPSLLKCCFEVQDDVKELFINEFKDIDVNKYITLGDIVEGNQKYFINSSDINKEVLKNIGILEKNIIEANICSKCNKEFIHSHRGDGPQSGRNIAFICLK